MDRMREEIRWRAGNVVGGSSGTAVAAVLRVEKSLCETIERVSPLATGTESANRWGILAV
jgi:cysteine synthase